MPITTKSVQIQTDDKPQVIVAGLVNKVMIFYGDINNKDNIFVGDEAVKRYVSGNTNGQGLIITPFNLNTNVNYNNLIKHFVDDSDKLYMIGKSGDILQVVIEESEIMTSIQNLINSNVTTLHTSLVQKFDLMLAILKGKLDKVEDAL